MKVTVRLQQKPIKEIKESDLVIHKSGTIGILFKNNKNGLANLFVLKDKRASFGDLVSVCISDLTYFEDEITLKND